MTDELQLLRASNPVSLRDLPGAPEELYERITGSRRRVPFGRVLAAAAAAAAVALAVTLLPSVMNEERSGGAIELALAAVSDGPVIHAVIEDSEVSATLVDLESGQTTDEVLRSEIWFDQERHQLHGRVTIGESLAFDGTAHATRIDPALAGFASRYREALESGQARIVGETTVDGRRAVRLRITLEEGFTEEIAVDADDYRPLRIRPAGSRDGRWFRVVSIEAIARDPADFAAADDRVFYSGLTTPERAVTVAEASTALGEPALWPGREVDGLDLRKIELLRVETRWSKGPPKRIFQEPAAKTEKPALRFHYGREQSDRRLELTVGTSAEELPLVGPLPHQRAPEGKLRLMGWEGRMWFGTLERDGLHFKFESPQRELVLAAARALSPLE
jgi:hypothetical protein